MNACMHVRACTMYIQTYNCMYMCTRFRQCMLQAWVHVCVHVIMHSYTQPVVFRVSSFTLVEDRPFKHELPIESHMH